MLLIKFDLELRNLHLYIHKFLNTFRLITQRNILILMLSIYSDFISRFVSIYIQYRGDIISFVHTAHTTEYIFHIYHPEFKNNIIKKNLFQILYFEICIVCISSQILTWYCYVPNSASAKITIASANNPKMSCITMNTPKCFEKVIKNSICVCVYWCRTYFNKLKI